MLRVDKRRNAAHLLRLRDRVQSNRRFTRRFGSVNFYDPSARKSSDPERQIKGQAARWNDLDFGTARIVAELHDRTLSVSLFDLRKHRVKRL